MDVLLAERFLEGAALGVGAVEDGYLVPGHVVVVVEVQDFLGHTGGFLQVADILVQVDGLSHGLLREHVLGDLSAVVPDDAVGCIDDGLCGTVVLFELEESRALV